jgi:hypothetical protein
MKLKKTIILALLTFAAFTSACMYIVLPEGLEAAAGVEAGSELKVWNAVATKIGQSEAGDLQIDVTIRNDTGDWSAMQSVESKPAVLKTGDGKSVNCDVVIVSTGGHRLAPGFQMRGYTTGKKAAEVTQPLYVECNGVEAAAGGKLSIPYVSFQGILDDYSPDANKVNGTLEINLDVIEPDLSYPIASPVEGLIQDAGVSITALSDNVVSLLDVQRNETGFQFTWQNFNPTKFALKTHIGTPPIIGADGIIYGAYEIIDLAPVPITPANENMQWTTEVVCPQDITGFYILLSVESKKPRTYVNYALDISTE